MEHRTEASVFGHELGHALYDMARRGGLIEQADVDALNKLFVGRDGMFNEEAFADAFGAAFANAFTKQEDAKRKRALPKGLRGRVLQTMRVIADTFVTLANVATAWRKVTVTPGIQSMLHAFILREQEAFGDFAQESAQGTAPSPNPNGETQDGVHPNTNGERYHISGVERGRWIDTMVMAKNGMIKEDNYYRVLDHIPDVFAMLGDKHLRSDIIDKPIEITGETLYKVLGGKHKIKTEKFAPLLDRLDDPIAVFNSATRQDSIVVLTEIEEDGKNVVAAIALYKTKQGRIVINELTSAYGKGADALSKWIEEGLLLYINKKKTASLPRDHRVQFPEVRLESVGSSYLTEDDLVKYRGSIAQRKKELQEKYKNSGEKYHIAGLYTGARVGYDKPDTHYVGTGEGNQVYGWGLYASNKYDVAQHYADRYTRTSNGDLVYNGPESLSDTTTPLFRVLTDIENIAQQYSNNNIENAIKTLSSNLSARVQRDMQVAQKYSDDPYFQNELKRTQALIDTLNRLDPQELGWMPRTSPPAIHGQTWWTHRAEGDESHLLEWTEHLSAENKARVLAAIESLGIDERELEQTLGRDWRKQMDYWAGSAAYGTVEDIITNHLSDGREDNAKKSASELLYQFGIDGIKYPVNATRGNTDYSDGANYVAFSDEHLRVDHQWQWNGSEYEQKYHMPNMEARRRAEQEAEAVRRKYEGTGQWMKAPNGKPTNLTKRQWLQVRTPSFKAWFGDWEKSPRIAKLRNSEPIVVSYNGEYELTRKGARSWALQNVRGTYINDDTQETITVARDGIKEATHHDAYNDAHLKSISAISMMIEKSIFIDELPNNDTTKSYESFRYYVCGLVIDGQPYTAKIVVGVRDGKLYYDHNLSQIEKGELLDLISRVTNTDEEGNSPLSAVKDTKLLSILQTNHSKVVDENGEPRVVYHGTTDGDFYIFNNYGSGIFATDDEGTAEAYSEDEEFDNNKVYDLFLNMRNPYIVNAEGKPFDDILYDGRETTTDDILEMALSDGYDGVIVENVKDSPSKWTQPTATDYIVSAPTQIKSATDNVGTFDGGNPDIRYHMPRGGAFRFSETYGGKMIVMAALDEIFSNSPKSVTGEREQEETGLSADEQKYLALAERLTPFKDVVSVYGEEAYYDLVATMVEVCSRFDINHPETGILSPRVRAAMPGYVQDIVANRASELGRKAYQAGREYAWELRKEVEREARQAVQAKQAELDAAKKAYDSSLAEQAKLAKQHEAEAVKSAKNAGEAEVIAAREAERLRQADKRSVTVGERFKEIEKIIKRGSSRVGCFLCRV